MEFTFHFFIISIISTTILSLFRIPILRVGILSILLLPVISSIHELLDYQEHSYILFTFPLDVMIFSIPSFLIGIFGGLIGSMLLGKKENINSTKEEIDEKGDVTKKESIKIFVVVGGVIWLFVYLLNPYKTWRENVSLSDGRIIEVEQIKRNYNGIAADSWLTINLPDISSQPIFWHGDLDPLVVNIDKGQLYIVATPLNGVRQYGNCRYINFVWNKGSWNRIPFDKIPERIYKTNMLIEDFPPAGTSFLKLSEKNSENVNGRGTLPRFLKQLDPERANDCASK